MLKKASKIALITLVALSLVTLASVAHATSCNSKGCWSGKVTVTKIDTAGRIWFVVDSSDQLSNLVPSDGCIVKSIWTGQAEPALYINPTDPKHDEKYALLLTAFVNDSVVGFGPVLDPATGWCAVSNIDLR